MVRDEVDNLKPVAVPHTPREVVLARLKLAADPVYSSRAVLAPDPAPADTHTERHLQPQGKPKPMESNSHRRTGGVTVLMRLARALGCPSCHRGLHEAVAAARLEPPALRCAGLTRLQEVPPAAAAAPDLVSDDWAFESLPRQAGEGDPSPRREGSGSHGLTTDSGRTDESEALG